MTEEALTPAQEAIVAALLGGARPDPEAPRVLGEAAVLAAFRAALVRGRERAAQTLAETARTDPGRGGELAAEALGRWAPPAEAAARLTELLALPLAAARRKVLRRALHLARSRGAAPGPAAPERPAAAAARAWLTAPDPRGRQLFVFSVDRPGRPRRALLAEVTEAGTLGDFAWLEGAEADPERLERRLRAGGLAPASVSWDYLRARLARVLAATEPPPVGAASVRAWLELQANGPLPPHPARALVSPFLQDLKPEQAAALAETPPFVGWTLPLDLLQPYREELAALDQSRLIVAGLSPVARRARRLGEILTELLTPEERRRWVERLLDAGLVLAAHGQEKVARAAVQLAGELEAAPPGKGALAFLRRLAERTLERSGRGESGAG